jgi:predicted RNA-binding protein
VASTRYWIGVVSKTHVERGVSGGFCQLCHGKAAALKRMEKGDWLIYYSQKIDFDGDEIYQRFTAIGRVIDDTAHEFAMSKDFVPFRRDIEYRQVRHTPVRPLLERLSFIKDTKRWGCAFRFGHFEIQKTDFDVIATAMLGKPLA